MGPRRNHSIGLPKGLSLPGRGDLESGDKCGLLTRRLPAGERGRGAEGASAIYEIFFTAITVLYESRRCPHSCWAWPAFTTFLAVNKNAVFCRPLTIRGDCFVFRSAMSGRQTPSTFEDRPEQCRSGEQQKSLRALEPLIMDAPRVTSWCPGCSWGDRSGGHQSAARAVVNVHFGRRRPSDSRKWALD